MYQVELTEKEVKGLGQDRWVNSHLKLIAGIGLSLTGAAITLLIIDIDILNYIWMFLCILTAILFVGKIKSVQKQFLSEIKSEQANHIIAMRHQD